MKMLKPSPWRSCPGRPGAVLLAAWLLSLTLAAPAGAAEETAAPPGEAAVPAKKKKAADAEPKGLTIEWDGKPLTKVKIINRMGRLKKINNWERLDELSRKAIAAGNEHGDQQLVTLGTWYQVYVLLKREPADEEGAFKKFQEAVGLGYGNVVEMTESPDLETLRQRPEVAEVIARLGKELAERLRAEFQAEVDAAFASSGPGAGKSLGADWKTVQDEPLWKEGSAMAVAVTRVHHEGFEKVLPALAKIREKAPVGLLFYQFDAADKGRKDQTAAYLRKLGLNEARYAVIDREAFKALTREVLARRAEAKRAQPGSAAAVQDEDRFQEYLPYLLFLDARGHLLYAACGVLDDNQLAYVLEKFLAHAGGKAGSAAAGAEKPAAPPVAAAKKAPATEEPPAEAKEAKDENGTADEKTDEPPEEKESEPENEPAKGS